MSKNTQISSNQSLMQVQCLMSHFYKNTQEDDTQTETKWIRNPFFASKSILNITLQDKLLPLAANE